MLEVPLGPSFITATGNELEQRYTQRILTQHSTGVYCTSKFAAVLFTIAKKFRGGGGRGGGWGEGCKITLKLKKEKA